VAAKTNQPILTDNEGRRIHPSWNDAGEVALAIMRGDHDDMLRHIQQACTTRLKGLWRKGMKVKLVGTRSVDLEGKEAVILKVNQKSITVGFGTATTDQWGTTYEGGEYNVSPSLLQRVEA
jgi:hypothetical protein